MFESVIYISGILAQLLFILCFIWRAYLTRSKSHHLFWSAIVLLFLLEYELYREILRLVGFPQPITPIRLMWFRLVYFALGFFYCDVLYYVEKVRALRRKS